MIDEKESRHTETIEMELPVSDQPDWGQQELEPAPYSPKNDTESILDALEETSEPIDWEAIKEIFPFIVMLILLVAWFFGALLPTVNTWAGDVVAISKLPFLSNALYCFISLSSLIAGFSFWRMGQFKLFWLAMFASLVISYGM